MKICIYVLLTVVAHCGLTTFTASAHPGSGIVVDAQGQVFFQDSVAATIWKIDKNGKVTAHHDKMGGHWMTLDIQGRFARSDLKLVERISPSGFTPVMFVADGEAPVTFNTDGNLITASVFQARIK